MEAAAARDADAPPPPGDDAAGGTARDAFPGTDADTAPVELPVSVDGEPPLPALADDAPLPPPSLPLSPPADDNPLTPLPLTHVDSLGSVFDGQGLGLAEAVEEEAQPVEGNVLEPPAAADATADADGPPALDADPWASSPRLLAPAGAGEGLVAGLDFYGGEEEGEESE